MKLYFYKYDRSARTIYLQEEEVYETPETYKVLPGRALFPFKSRCELKKSELGECAASASGLACVLERRDDAAARRIFRNHAERELAKARERVERASDLACSIESAGIYG